jgi:hypothetical protein
VITQRNKSKITLNGFCDLLVKEKKPNTIRPIDINIDAKPNACINKSAAYEPG